MKNLLSLFWITFFLSTLLLGQEESIFPNQEGEELLQNLVGEYKPLNVLDYNEARDFLYGEVYNENDTVKGLYSNHPVYLPLGVDPSAFLYMDGSSDGINAEHTYPQSKGAREGRGRSDMHHLFPARVGVNSARSNLPFGEVLDIETREWYYLDQMQNSIPTEDIDEWSERGRFVFEPREDIKGNVARAIFYFYTMYNKEAVEADDLFFDIQRVDLCKWHILDRVDAKEVERTWSIATFQDDNPNPFILDCSLAARTYCSDLLTDCQLKTVATTSKELPSLHFEQALIQPYYEALSVESLNLLQTNLEMTYGAKIALLDITQRWSFGMHLMGYTGITPDMMPEPNKSWNTVSIKLESNE